MLGSFVSISNAPDSVPSITSSRARPTKPPTKFFPLIVFVPSVTEQLSTIAPFCIPINPPAYSLSDAVEIVKLFILQFTIFGLIYPVGINFPKGIAFPNRILIKSPKPKPGMTFKIFVNNLTKSPKAFDNPSY